MLCVLACPPTFYLAARCSQEPRGERRVLLSHILSAERRREVAVQEGSRGEEEVQVDRGEVWGGEMEEVEAEVHEVQAEVGASGGRGGEG